MKRLIISMTIIASFVVGGLAFGPASAAQAADCPNQNPFFPSWYDGLCEAGTGNIMPPTNGGNSAQDTGQGIGGWLSRIALNIATMILTAAAYVSLAFVIYGGFKYITSGDNSSGTQAARKTITNAIIGLVISIMAVAIINFITGFFG